MGGRFARSQMAGLQTSGLGRQPRLRFVRCNPQLLELIHQEQQIPEEQLRTSSRKNVGPDGEKVTLQMAGLVTSCHWRHIPVAGKETYQHLRLQQLIFMCRCPGAGHLSHQFYLYFQITKNLQTKPHKDKKNSAFSLIFTLGEHTGGVAIFRRAVAALSPPRRVSGGDGGRDAEEAITSELEELARKAARAEKVPDEAGRHEPKANEKLTQRSARRMQKASKSSPRHRCIQWLVRKQRLQTGSPSCGSWKGLP
eukprot:s2427_g14.t1